MSIFPDRVARAPWWLFFTVASGAATAACGTIAEDPVVASCAAFAQARATYFAHCNGQTTRSDADRTTCEALTALPGSLLGRGALAACVDDIRRSARNCTLGQPACLGYHEDASLFPGHDQRGTLPAGTACVAGFQCADGYCTDAYGLGYEWRQACKTCRSPVAIGEPCLEGSNLCVSPYADGFGVGCVEGACAFVDGDTLGSVCSSYGGDSCRLDLHCFVVPGTGVAGICVERTPLGVTCTDHGECDLGASCIDGRCVTTPPTPPECTGDAQCSGRRCIDLHCVDTGASEGEACGSCAGALECVAGVCTYPAFLTEGQPCSYEAQCEPSLVCNVPCDTGGCGGTCLPSGPGAACTHDLRCEGDTACDSQDYGEPGICKPITRSGAGGAWPCAAGLEWSGIACVAIGAMCPAP